MSKFDEWGPSALGVLDASPGIDHKPTDVVNILNYNGGSVKNDLKDMSRIFGANTTLGKIGNILWGTSNSEFDDRQKVKEMIERNNMLQPAIRDLIKLLGSHYQIGTLLSEYAS